MKQFDDNMSAADWALNEEQIKRLNTVSTLPKVYYPYGFIEGAKRQ